MHHVFKIAVTFLCCLSPLVAQATPSAMFNNDDTMIVTDTAPQQIYQDFEKKINKEISHAKPRLELEDENIDDMLSVNNPDPTLIKNPAIENTRIVSLEKHHPDSNKQKHSPQVSINHKASSKNSKVVLKYKDKPKETLQPVYDIAKQTLYMDYPQTVRENPTKRHRNDAVNDKQFIQNFRKEQEGPPLVAEEKSVKSFKSNKLLTPYIGIAEQSIHMGYKQGFGDNLFPTTLHATELFGGIKIWDAFALEVGYSESNQRHKAAVLHRGDTYLGVFIDPDEPFDPDSLTTNNTAKVSSFRANILTFVPFDSAHRINGILGGGITHTRTAHQMNIDLIDGIPPQVKEQSSFKGSTNSLMLTAGIEYKISSHFSVRATANYQGISDGGELKSKEPPTANDRILKIRNGTSFNLGVVLNL